MTIKTTTVILPAFLASALINGDESGLDDADLARLGNINAFLRKNNLEIVDVARDADGNAHDPWFTWSYRFYGGDADGGDCLDYVAFDHSNGKEG